jgi:hypothetical protein
LLRIFLIQAQAQLYFLEFSNENTLKGPKHEIFESGFFTQIIGLWLGDFGTGEKN